MRHGIKDILLSDDYWYLKWFCYLLALVGFFRFLMLVYRVLCFTLRHCCRCRSNLLKKYSEKGNPKSTWAVVTGGSDGIGLEFCRKFAQQGFNICMIARNESKMEAKLRELQDLYPTI